MGGRGQGTDRGSGKFGGGGGTVLEGYGKAEQALARKIFGKNMSASDLITMAGGGGFDGGLTAEIGINRDGRLQIDLDHKLIDHNPNTGGGVTQQFYRDKGGAKIYMEAFFLKKEAQGKGIGGKSLYKQKEMAVKHGVKEINLHALRSDTANGHQAWADMGFNGKLNNRLKDDWQRANPMDALRGKKAPNTVRELYKRNGGREFWIRKAEVVTEMVMPLKRGSEGVKILDKIATRKGWRK
jgi:GNAT superfamily N-acetyltransferase